jgi:hypothetical protein
MHQKLASDGLAVMSVSIDDKDEQDAALRFLKSQQATFVNYLLDEKSDVWQEKFKINAPPAIFVFDQQGQQAAKFYSEDPAKAYTHADVEALVRQLLAQPQ